MDSLLILRIIYVAIESRVYFHDCGVSMVISMIKAEQYCVNVFDGTHDTPKPMKKGHKLLTSKNIMKGFLDKTNAYSISDEDYEKINLRSRVSKWDILFSMIGTVGNVCLITDDDIDFTIKNMGVFSCEDENKAKWLYFYLQSPYAKNLIKNYLNGAVQKFLGLEKLRAFPIQEFDIEKKRITDFLWSIEEKININNKLCHELESMAKTIFDYWFLQFDFPDAKGKPYKSAGGEMVWNDELKREIPIGWETGKLEDFVEIGNGKDHKELADGNIPVYGSGGIMRYADKYLYEGESVLIPRKGTLNNIMYVNESFWTVDTMFFTKMRKRHSALFVYYTVKLYDFEKLNTGTGVPSMTSSIVYSLKIVIPDEDVLKRFDNKMQVIYQEIKHLKKENQELASLRDFLLPLLMNGQVDFKNQGYVKDEERCIAF